MDTCGNPSSGHPGMQICTGILCVAVYVAALILMPGAPAVMTTGVTVTIGCIAVALYRRSESYTASGQIVLTVAMTLMAVGIVANVHYFTVACGHTDANPLLLNPDAARNWRDAMYFMGVSDADISGTHTLYGWILAAVMKPFGPSITIALSLGYACGTVTLLLTAAMAKRLTSNAVMATAAMIATACVCYLMASATVLVKDIWVVTATAVAGYGLCQWRRTSVAFVTVGCIMLALARNNFIFAVVGGVIITASGVSCAEMRRQLPARVLTLVLATGIWALMSQTEFTPDAAAQIVGASDFEEYRAPNQEAFYRIVGDGLNESWTRKLLLAPVLIITQFLIPLPWNFLRDTVFGPTQAYAHFAYPWYFFGAVLLFYLFGRTRRVCQRRMFVFTLWGVFVWLIPCFTAMGTVSRYALPAVPLMAPAVGATALVCYRKRRFLTWLAAFAIILAVTLLTVYNLQTAAAQ